jgi:hypothetical protein
LTGKGYKRTRETQALDIPYHLLTVVSAALVSVVRLVAGERASR